MNYNRISKYSKILIIAAVFILWDRQTFSKPQVFYLEASREGYIEANVRTPIEIKISPAFPCTSLRLRIRTKDHISIYGSTDQTYESCTQVSHLLEITLPQHSKGSMIIDVNYKNAKGQYSGSMSLRYTSIPLDIKSQNNGNGKQERGSLQNTKKPGRENIKILPAD